ncbi:MAG: succinate--CoA ligase subunit beta [Thermofilum sp. ex4484_79]|nr:MAG: succinate--CoA ligase subunit beta [Thermofilum sp. ex4484_79]
MKLYEYEAKDIFAKYGIPVQRGGLAVSPAEVRKIAEELNRPVVLKAQVPVAGRGKAGGILFADTPEEAEAKAREMFKRSIKGYKIEKILVVKRVDIAREMYLSITIDRFLRKTVIIASRIGGMEIEEIARQYPEMISKYFIDPLIGLKDFHVRGVVASLRLDEKLRKEASLIARKMYQVFIDYDCELVESNPLVITRDNKIIAVDARIIIDDNSLFKHKELAEKYYMRLNENEKVAKKYGFSYVELDGDIGIIGNGAGLTMASMDIIEYFGGKAANFLDIGGGANAERVREALLILLRNDRIKAVFINILGGITRCDEVARGIVEAITSVNAKKPIVVRMIGTREEEGRKILSEYGIKAFSDMNEAAKHVVNLVKEAM